MIIKTMTLALDGNNMLDNEQVSRSARFTGEISGYLAKLSALYLDEVVANANMARMLNENIALFLKDALRIYDRGVIMELIYLYTDNLPRSAVQLKFDFLKVIGDYEHYVPLNFPVPDNLSDVVAVESILFRAHFLSSLIVQEVVKQVEKQEWANILIGVDCLFQIALKHHQDTRYQHVLAQKCIPGMYFLLVIKLVDANDFDYRCVSEAPYEIRRKLLALFLWIVNNIQRKVLQQWWVVDTQKRVISFFMLLANCIHTFEYQNSGSTSDPEFFQTRKGSSVIHDQSIDSVKKRSGSQIRSTLTSPLTSAHTNENELKKEQNMSREVTLIVLDLLMDFMNDHLSELRKPESVYMERVVINSLALLLRRKQCESALIALFAAVRHTVVMFPGAFFVDITPFCGEITYGILRHCNSNSKSILAKASALFYLLIRNNYRACGNFSRMKLQATIAISQLVGEGSDIIPEQFQATLAAVTAFAQKDESMKDTFKKEVAELTVRLFLVLKNSKRIEEYSYDPEMTADLFYEMSKGYVASPDLRAAWLSNLANYHETHSNFEEAAQCKIHLAALVSVYINKLKPKESVTINPLQFKRAAPNSSTEMNVPPEAFEEEGICQSTIFTRSGMFTHLQSAVTHLKTDSIFESCIAVQRLIVDVHKENRNYAAMSSVFGDLQKLSNEILTSNASNSRLFSSYYLVGFYGQPFGDLNGAQFIYKERQMVRLADISNRLKEQFAQKFGACTTLASSANLEELDPSTAHILVLSVKPYLTAEELQSEDRQSNFEKQFNIQRFIYETPMTTTGKKYSDEITEQAKKKTILETDTPFPFVIKRLRVVRSTSEILSPIQTAIELIDDRCRVTLQELEAIPPNSKTLQIILQGSVLVQVNAGPLAIAKTFLNARQSYPAEDIAKLEDSMRNFVILCDRGIKLNKSLIGPDQIEFHEHLHKGNEELRAEVAKLIPNGVPSTPRNPV